jgi:hypothetical protein
MGSRSPSRTGGAVAESRRAGAAAPPLLPVAAPAAVRAHDVLSATAHPTRRAAREGEQEQARAVGAGQHPLGFAMRQR